MSEFTKLSAILLDSDAATIREAAEAYKQYGGDDSEDLHPKYAFALFTAVMRLRGKYILALEKHLAAYYRIAGASVTSEGQDEYLAAQQEELRPLWRDDLEHVIREAGGKLW